MRKFLINVNGKSYDVEVEEVRGGSAPIVAAAPQPAAAPVPTPPPAAAAPVTAPAPAAAPKATAPASNVAGTKVEAPMPGTIMKVNVKVGDTVSEGDPVVVLEAMKMENDIPATVSGKVAAVNVSSGDNVEAGAVLVVIG